ncbi:MAG: DUF2207 domain-containing protein [Patescibacteria group bacterium]|nr:DUF2207 domain-containing protein [Patescibacteria group bacterium]
MPTRPLALAALLALGLLAPLGARAAETEQYATAITIAPDASIRVVETITTDPLGPHGIYRDVPFAFTTADGRAGRLAITDVSATDENGAPYEVVVSEQGGNEHIRVGDPNVTVSGVKTYVISYTVRGAVVPYPGFDELYWNATPPGWQAPVASSSAQVELPAPVPVAAVRSACYEGAAGSKESCAIATRGDVNGVTAVAFAGRALAPGEGLTVAVGFPKGLVTYPPPVPWWRQWLFTLLGGALLVLAAAFAIVFAIRDRKGRGVIIPIYEPPRAQSGRPLRPAEADVLVHGRVGRRAWPATVVDLAVRGLVTIEEAAGSWWTLWRKDYPVKSTGAERAGLEPWEASFFDALLAGGTFSTRALRRDTAAARALYMNVQQIEQDLRKEVATDTAAYVVDPQTARVRKVVLLVGLIIGCLSAFFLSAFGRDAMFAGYLVLAATGITLYVRSARVRLNAAGAKEREDWLGFKLYLETAEKYRLENLTPDQFQKFLPYAMVFGVEKKWARAFAGIAMPPPAWYSGSAANAGLFSASACTASFSNSFAASGAGGASGGGGGAGGGGGGGGGGGW